MTNLKAIRALVQCARSANRMAMHYTSMHLRARAQMWRACRTQHMATARRLKQDAKQ